MKIAVFAIALSGIIWGGCSNKNEPDLKLSTACLKGEKLHSAKEREGILHYNEDYQMAQISYHIPGSYDAVEIGILCEVPDELKLEYQKVIFNGDYYRYDGDELPLPAGSEPYYLNIRKIRFK